MHLAKKYGFLNGCRVIKTALKLKQQTEKLFQIYSYALHMLAIGDPNSDEDFQRTLDKTD